MKRLVLLACCSLFGCSAEVNPVGEGEAGEGEAAEGEGEGEAADCSVDKGIPGANLVVNGTREPTHVLLSEAQQLAVVAIGERGSEGGVCSGALIAEDVVLSAVHCTEDIDATHFTILFGIDDLAPVLQVAVVEKTENPDHDIAMLRLASHPADAIDVQPIAVFGGTLLESDVGEIFEQSGYGATETGDSNGRFFVAEPFYGFEDDYLMVNGEGRHGVCFGDSGGPSLRQTVDGDVRVMGALSWGDESCVDIDRYTRVDLVQDWIEAFAGPIPDPGSTVASCGTVTSTGRCSPDGSVAEYCEADVLLQVQCADDEVCSDTVDGKRCVAASNVPCGTVTAFGTCSGDVLTWCDGDTVRVRDCDACGGDVCRLVDSVVGYACVEHQCGTIDFLGECDGNVARWCDNGVIKTEDCTESGTTCAFVDDDSGYYCQ
jgi:hypothetical protein